MKEKEVTLEVVNKNNEREERVKNLTNIAEQIKTAIENKSKELETKTYIVEGGKETANHLKDFLTKEAQWKFTEAMGIPEAIKEIDKGVKNMAKTKELMLNPLAIEATYYFITKVEGKGYDEAIAYYNNLLKPVSDALSRSKADRQELDQMQKDLATIENAIDMGAEVEDSMVKEIKTELANGTYGKTK